MSKENKGKPYCLPDLPPTSAPVGTNLGRDPKGLTLSNLDLDESIPVASEPVSRDSSVKKRIDLNDLVQSASGPASRESSIDLKSGGQTTIPGTPDDCELDYESDRSPKGLRSPRIRGQRLLEALDEIADGKGGAVEATDVDSNSLRILDSTPPAPAPSEPQNDSKAVIPSRSTFCCFK